MYTYVPNKVEIRGITLLVRDLNVSQLSLNGTDCVRNVLDVEHEWVGVRSKVLRLREGHVGDVRIPVAVDISHNVVAGGRSNHELQQRRLEVGAIAIEFPIQVVGQVDVTTVGGVKVLKFFEARERNAIHRDLISERLLQRAVVDVECLVQVTAVLRMRVTDIVVRVLERLGCNPCIELDQDS